MAIEQNITKEQGFFTGEDKVLAFSIFKADNATPEPITGWRLSWVIDGPEPRLLEKTTDGGISIVDGPAGLCDVQIDDVDTDGWPPGIYRHELKRTDPGEERVLAYGTVYVQGSLHN